MQKFKFNFTYTDKKVLEKQLMSFSSFMNIVDGIYRYRYMEEKIADITIVDEGLLVTNYTGKGWIFFSLEKLLMAYYKELRIFNLTDNIPYVFEKFKLTKMWLDLGLISKEELDKDDSEIIPVYHCVTNHIHIKYIKRWLKTKESLDDRDFNFLLPHLKKLAFFIRILPLNEAQIDNLKELGKHNENVKNALFYRRILNEKLTKKLLDEVLEKNEIDLIKAFINQTNEPNYLEYILEHNRLDSDKVNNIIRKKLGTKKVYLQKEKSKKVKTNPHVRVHILIAMESSKSLIIRRGSSKKMCTILWDREKNTFVAGDCTVKIEERLADISPDGNYFYYLGWTHIGAWSAIAHTNSLRNMVFYREDGYRCGDVPSSHPPYVYDLYKYFMKIRPYGDTNLNNGFPRFKTMNRKFEKENWDICNITAVYYRRLIRDGWSIIYHEGEDKDKYISSYETHFEKELKSDWYIKKIAYDVHPAPIGKNGGHWDTHQLLSKSNGKVYDFPNWDWAEKDEACLYWTEKGLLYKISLVVLTTLAPKEIESNAELLCDLNTFRVDFGKRRFTLDGDVDVLRGLRHEESYKANNDTTEYHYLKSIENGGVDACFYLGQLYLNKIECLEKALIYSEKGFERAMKKEQLTYWHHEYYGHILFKNEYYTKAYKIFESSLNYTSEDKDRAVSYNYLGVLCKLGKKYKKAVDFFEKAVKLDDTLNC